MIKTVFMGADAIALPVLDALAGDLSDRLELAGVFAGPDRRSGRGMKVQANPVKAWAVERGVPVRQPDKIGPGDLAWLRDDCRCELALVMAYGHLLKPGLLALPRLGVFNFHTSLLPAYRGASPVETALAMGETEVGVCLMAIEPTLDTGPVADREKVAVDPADTAATLREKQAAAAARLALRALPEVLAGRAQLVPQDGARATYCRRLEKEDAEFDYNRPAAELARRVRAFQPWPGALTYFQGTRLKVGAAAALPDPIPAARPGAAPGEVLGLRGGALHVATAAGVLALQQLQRPGGKMLPAEAFLRGFPVPAGARLEGRPAVPLVSDKPFSRAGWLRANGG